MYFNCTPLQHETVTGARNAVVGLLAVLAVMSVSARAEEGIRIPANLCSWEARDWQDLNAAEKVAWSGLGWTKQTWDDAEPGAYPASYRKSWPELVYTEKLLARELGFTRKTWDAEGCPNYSRRARKQKDTSGQAGTDSSAD